jgi:N-acyl-D-amino-acid deacylase
MSREIGIPLAQMVWRLSTLPCRFLKLPDPTLKIGADASLVLFDPNSVCERNDYADDGIDLVWVHGELILEHGKLVAPRRFPGRILTGRAKSA